MPGTGPGSNATITLPSAAAAPWYVAPSGGTPGKSKLLTLYHTAASDGTCTVQTTGGQKIFTTATGVTSLMLAANGTLKLRSDGANWYPV